MANKFRRPEYYEHVIERGGKILGRIRIKPNAILWGEKESKKWHVIRLSEFRVIMDGKPLVEK